MYAVGPAVGSVLRALAARSTARTRAARALLANASCVVLNLDSVPTPGPTPGPTRGSARGSARGPTPGPTRGRRAWGWGGDDNDKDISSPSPTTRDES